MKFDFNKLSDKNKVIYMTSYISALTEFIHVEYKLSYEDIPTFIAHFTIDLFKKRGGKKNGN